MDALALFAGGSDEEVAIESHAQLENTDSVTRFSIRGAGLQRILARVFERACSRLAAACDGRCKRGGGGRRPGARWQPDVPADGLMRRRR